jgi:hypothetical protein
VVSGIYITDAKGKLRLAHQGDVDEYTRAAQAEEATRLLFAHICSEPNLSQRRRMIAAAMAAVAGVPEFKR